VETLDLLRRGWGLDPFAAPLRLEFPLNAQDERAADQVLRESGGKGGTWVAFAPGAAYGPTKRWDVESWRALADLLLRHTMVRLALVGSREEAATAEGILTGLPPAQRRRAHSWAGRTGVTVLGALLSRCRVLVTNDTGPMHVAAGVGTPVVAVFGSTSPEWTRPLGTGHRVLYRQAPCSPCFRKECHVTPRLQCLTAITPEYAWRALWPMLMGKPVRVGPERLQP
jgi:lipopolysaccharide heptosyltransferase II